MKSNQQIYLDLWSVIIYFQFFKEQEYVVLSDLRILYISSELFDSFQENSKIFYHLENIMLEINNVDFRFQIGFNNICSYTIKYLSLAGEALNIEQKKEFSRCLNTLIDTLQILWEFFKNQKCKQDLSVGIQDLRDQQFEKFNQTIETAFEYFQRTTQTDNMDEQQKVRLLLINETIQQIQKEFQISLENKVYQFAIKRFNDTVEGQIEAIYAIQAIQKLPELISLDGTLDQHKMQKYVKECTTKIKKWYIPIVVLIDSHLYGDFHEIYKQLSLEIKLPDEEKLYLEFANRNDLYTDYIAKLNQKLYENGVFNSANEFQKYAETHLVDLKLYKETILIEMKKFFKEQITQIMSDITNGEIQKQ